jgi:hypothetical protein
LFSTLLGFRDSTRSNEVFGKLVAVDSGVERWDLNMVHPGRFHELMIANAVFIRL